ncbi:hypothetical protein CMUS01_13768 [Colletotrichum musicola]|uniref:Uncharacterized protein n=1 Tax=Colletotrichum musicola TaxID=2175873 RepID=A0A8H6JAA1_9PEZI|nr:hypothetical protein CMUS01_13768 [Colletotrichum musicola]
MSDEWFTSKLFPYGNGSTEDGCRASEAQALKDYLRKKTTAAEAARAITQQIDHSITAEDNLNEELPRLWGLLQDALWELPEENIEPLIELLKAIEELPKPDISALERRKQPEEALWKGLSGGAEVEARMVAAGSGGMNIDEGYKRIADALESSNWLLELNLPAAAKWLAFLGKQFFEGAKDGKESWGLRMLSTSMSQPGYRDLSKSKSDVKMTLERWEFWEARLRELQREEGHVGEAAKLSLTAIDKIHASS